MPGVPEGVFKRKVILVTDQPNEQAAPLGDGSQPTHVGEMWLRTDVEGVFEYRPERFDFGRMLPGQRVTKKIIIRSRDPEFDMGAVRVALFDGTGVPLAYEDEFDIEAKAIDPGKAWEIEIQIVDPPVTGGFGGIVGIKLDHPLQEDIQIPFMGRLSTPN